MLKRIYTDDACGSLSPHLAGNRGAKGWRRRSVSCLDEVITLEGRKIWKPIAGEHKAPSLFGRWAEQEGAWKEMVVTLCS